MSEARRDYTGLRLMAVHAHPDDESSKGAATTARYAALGAEVLVVTCTGGERGSILNPTYGAAPSSPELMAQVRRTEMAAAAAALGVRQTWLGFVDSGLPEGDPLPPLPEGCFAHVPLEDASEPLVRLVREFRPHVVTTYDPTGGYPHPVPTSSPPATCKGSSCICQVRPSICVCASPERARTARSVSIVT